MPQLNRFGPIAASIGGRTLFAGAVGLLLFGLTVSADAAPLTLVQEPDGSGHYAAVVADSFDATGVANADDWSFEAEIGDQVSARLEAAVGSSKPRLRLLNASGTALYSFDGGSDGVAVMNRFVITTPGTYRVRVYSDSAASAYSLRFDLGRGVDLESEPNNTVESATVVRPMVGFGQFTFAAAGALPASDGAGDLFALGLVRAGGNFNAAVQLPGTGSLTPGDVTLQLYRRYAADQSLDLRNNTYATIPHNAEFDAIETANAVTIEAWIYIRSWPQGYFTVLDKYKAAGDWGWIFAIQNGGGGISFWNGNNTRATADVTPSLNAWHHVAVAYDHGANSVRFYLDGALVATKASPGPLTDTSGDPAYIGFSPSGGDEYSDGLISELRIWNRALSTAEVQADYAADAIAPDASGLVGLWRLDEGTGTSAADATSFGNTMTLGNGSGGARPGWASGAVRPASSSTGTSISSAAAADADLWLQIAAANNRSLSAGYYLSGTVTDTTPLHVVGTSLPVEAGSTSDLTQGFTVTFDDELDPAAANTMSNYELRGAGADGTLGTADDIIYTLGNANYTNGTTVSIPLTDGPMQPGPHRLTIGVGLRDRSGNPLTATYTLTFTSQPVAGFTIENQDNATFATATPISMSANGTGFIGGGRGNLSSNADVDVFSFTANAGDRIFVTSENPGHPAATGPYYHLHRSDTTEFTGFGTYDGTGQTQFVAPSTGTYYVRVTSYYTSTAEYRFAVATMPGTMDMEHEGNSSAGAANGLTWARATGSQSASVAGVLTVGDSGGDWYQLGFLDTATQVSLSAAKPPASSANWILDILDSSSQVVISAPAGTPTLAYTVADGKAGTYYARIRPSDAGDMFAHYMLSVTLADSTPPAITGDSLPAEGATVTNFFGNFALNFSEGLQPATVNASDNYDLRAAGPDGVFDTTDDVLYSVATASAYTGGFSATYLLTDGPTQPGLYRFEVKPQLLDIYGNSLAATYTRTFTVAGVPDYVLESRSNETFATATSMAPGGAGTGFSGSWQKGVQYGTAGATPVSVAAADFNHDGRLDLVTANYDGGTLSVLKNNGDGTFAPATTYPAPNQPFKLAVADFNGDGAPDVVVTRRYGAAIRVFLNANDASGAFAPGVDVTTPAGPMWLAVADLNGDSKADVVTANYDANNVSILPGNGDGTFAAPANIAVSGNPYSVAVGDLNGDGRPDIAVGTWTDRAVKVFYRQGDGSYLAGPVFTWGAADGIASVTIADIDGDNRPDLLAVGYGQDVRRWNQQADGTLVAGTPLNYGTTVTAYSVIVQDFDGDGIADVIVGRNGYVSIFQGLGDGSFSGPTNPSTAGEARQVVIADLNGDGRPDIVTTSQQYQAVMTFLGLPSDALPADGSGTLGRARGQIASSTDNDFYSFSAKAGDRVFVTSENPGHPGGSGAYFRVYAPDYAQITAYGTYDGTGQAQFVAPVSGTYFIQATQYYTYAGEYRIAVATFPGTTGLESESNNSAGQADGVTWTETAGAQTAAMAGVLTYADPGDWFNMGFLDVGTSLTITATKPPSSGVHWILDVINSASQVVASSAVDASSYTYTIPDAKADTYYARIRASSGADLLGQYRLTFALGDNKPPTITGDTLPTEGTTVTNFFGDFQLSFSETLRAATVNDASNYDLRSAGPDGAFGTADDAAYHVVLTSTYSSGLTQGFRISDGPPQPGLYRLQVNTGLQDLYGNAMAAVYTRTFTITGVADYILESRSDDTFATATSFSPAGEGSAFSGSWRDPVPFPTGGATPMSVVAVDLDKDGRPDLVTANWDGGTISVLKGNGDGTFAAATTYPAPNQPFKLIAGDFNGDGAPDVAVTRRYGSAVRVFLNKNDGSGALAAGVDATTGAGPIWLASADLNGDGKPDIVSANYDANNVSILYNNGDGTFASAVSVAMSGNPYSIAIGDLNGDGLPDIAVGTWTQRSVKVLYRQADGTYAAGPVFTWGANDGIGGVAIGDLDGDNRADLLAVDYGADVRRWNQQPDGTLVAGTPLGYGTTTTGFSVLVQDYNGDGRPDILVGRSGAISVFENLGGGSFAAPANETTNGDARQVAVADLNGDGRPDLVAPVQQANNVDVWLGRGVESLAADGTGFLGRVRGQLSTTSDVDYYSFSAHAGDRVFVDSQNPGNPGGTGCYYRIYRPDGAEITNFATYDGSGETQFVAPFSGTYFVRVQAYYTYAGEYRVAVAVLPGTMQLESESNNAANQADTLGWTQGSASISATVAGALNYGDPGDWFALGSLADGAQVSLGASAAPSSDLSWILEVLNASGNAVASSAAGAPSLSFTVPARGAGVYYARIRASAGADLLAHYQMSLTVTDTEPPAITRDTLPAEGATILNLFDRFTLTFSEDMSAPTVNDLNNYDLRTAGPDNTFDTTDDEVIPLALSSTYASGTSIELHTADGATLPVGSYRFRAFSGLLDKYGNALAPVYTRQFSVGQLPGYTYDTEPNNSFASATAMPLAGSQPNLAGGGARGYLLNGQDVDFWSFDLQAGDRVYIQGMIPGTPGGSALRYDLLNPAGTAMSSITADYNGAFAFPLFTASAAGTYGLKVSTYYGYYGEYRFRVYVLRGDLQVETEPNDSIANATAVTLTPSDNNLSGSVQGVSRQAGDLDYFNLGTLQAGTTVFLSTREPSGSTFVPVVSLYDSNGNLMAEATGGRAGDPVAQVPISVTGNYYALVRTSGETSGLDSEYILDALVVPTSGVTFPNLQVTSLTAPPATGLKSGDTTSLSFRVDNLGNLDTPAVTWVDRVVLSTDSVYGNADDLELGVFTHAGPLAAGANYTVNANVKIPDGIGGPYYVIAHTDHTNTVNEFVLEGDNETASANPITITRASYPDLTIENLAVGDADANGTRTATWTLANHGDGPATAGFAVRLVVRNNRSGAVVANSLAQVASDLAAGGTLAQQATFSTTAAGTYTVEATADAQAQRYEYNPSGNAAAEANNVGSASFSITQLYTVTVAAQPTAGGSATGGGTFAEGNSTTVTATATAPYVFTGWFEGEFLRSVNASYTFPLLSDRNLTARFALPSYVIGTQVSPAGTGVVTGGGVYAQGASVSLTASPLPGYLFGGWTEAGAGLGTTTPLTFTAAADRTIVATFVEANPSHMVTTATNPGGVATVSGSGTYSNGQSTTISAPASVVSGDTEYVFQGFDLNGAPLTTATSIAKSFTTLDAPTLAYVARYSSRPVKPAVTQVTSNYGNRVGLGASVQFTIHFDRPMNTGINPVVELVSSNATSIPAVPGNGTWTSSDTYAVPAIVIGSTNGGDYQVRISAAQDTQGRTMDPTTTFSFTIDVTAPPLPALAAGPVTATSATVDWSGYAAPSDLASFRVYRSASTFTTLDGLSPIASLPAGMRTYGFAGLAIDTDYYVAVVPVDTAGNAATTVAPLKIRVASTVPPPIDFTVSALSSTSARIAWSFDATNQIGFSGFKIYRANASFTSIDGMTPVATLATDKTSYDDLNLDRTQPQYYTVVGYNALGQSITNVVSKPWTDPLSGTLTSDFTATDSLLVITQPLTIANGATFTVPPGTTVAFAPGAGITVQSGKLIADGTVFAPIVFTSLADVQKAGPTRGSWDGIKLSDAAHASTLRNVWIKYGNGLLITAGSHVVDTLGAAWNDNAGLQLSGTVALTTHNGYFANNAVGVSAASGATLTISGSVLKNNAVNAAASGSSSVVATGNWWGTADPAAMATTVSGAVTTDSPLLTEPVLTRGLRTADGASSTGSASVVMQLASLNATSYRLSEDSSFGGALFVDVPRDPLSTDLFNTAAWPVTVPLSAGGGTKTLYAQFRSPTGDVSPTASFTINYITAGPVISAFSLHEGDTVTRPVTVTASVTTGLPIASVVFAVDGVTVASSSTSSLNARWDMRALPSGIHRVTVAATDSAGNVATSSANVIISPTPPPRPVLTAPTNGLKTSSDQVNVTGTAEPLGQVRLTRNGATVATVTADASGVFTIPNVALQEGTNELVALASDALGTTASASVFASLDTGAPAAVTLLPLSYNIGEGLFVDWNLPTTGEVPVMYKVFWNATPFTSPEQASGQSAQLMPSYTVLANLPDGQYYVAVVGYDEAGNASPMSNVEAYTLDSTPPSFAIAYDHAMPVGPGNLGITVTASEPLKSVPLLLLRNANGSVVSVSLTAAGGNSYTASFPVTALSASSGTTSVGVSGTDLAGNTTTGAPTGPALVFDLTKPTGVISTTQAQPVQTVSAVTLGVSLALSEPVKLGTTPTLTFAPPTGANVPITLTGGGENWSGSLTVTPQMATGEGTFLLNATDAVGNDGTVITSGEHLELYDAAVPPAPAVPGNVTITPLKGGHIRLTWSAADKAQSYNLYREPGPGPAAPTTLVMSDITSLSVDDLPPADGEYHYAVTAFRLGAESGPSGVRAATSDRTAPAAPTATTVALGPTGINVSWTPATGEAAAKWVIYRNGVAIQTVNSPAATAFVDSPPRGTMTYTVAASDQLGNEAQGPSATIELLVGAVANLRALVDNGVGTVLSWTSSDTTSVGFNVYRDGVKQTTAPVTTATFPDPQTPTTDPVTYKITAVNASGQESAPRVVVIQPLSVTIHRNPGDSGDQPSVAQYFDTYALTLTAGAHASAALALSGGEVVRTVAGETPADALFALPPSLAAGETASATAVIAAPATPGLVQGTAITLSAVADAGGSLVQYRYIQDFDAANPPGLMMTVSTTEPPLAGGTASFTVQVYNNGHAAADLVLTRAGNSKPGDLEMLIINQDGVLVSSTPMAQSVPGVLVDAAGDAFLRLEPGASAQIPFDDVLVPESLSQQTVTFRARFKVIYHDLGTTTQRVAGPLEGSMQSALRQTSYYATSSVSQESYSDNQPIVISGQAIDRATGNPLPNTPVRIGIRVRGAVIYDDVTTDSAGNYSYSYTPSAGLSGQLVIWAAHPDVVDQLDQVHVNFYRIFTNPSQVQAVMSKNDTLDFNATLMNPGDAGLGAPTVTFRAYQVQNGAEVDVPGVTGVVRTALPAALDAKAQLSVGLRLQATLDVPDDALFDFTFTTPQGASTTLHGTISFRPALAVIAVTSPAIGYVEAGVAQGEIKSVDVTVQNNGLRALSNVRIVPPANTSWMQVNLASDANGNIPLGDIPVGGTRTFSVVFAPPADTPVGYYNDSLTIAGDNSTGDFKLNLFGTVTSEQNGSVLFSITNTFGNPVPNTSIWLRNTTLGTEVGPVLTDANGQVKVDSLMEGDWQWKTQAAGHSGTQGVVRVVPNQTVGVESELFVTMVTVKFSVVPVPFTDYYEIKLEQTFQTRTPIPNLILSPPHQTLDVESGWSGTLLYTLRNEGLRSVFDVTVSDATLPTMRVTPLVNFIPEIKAQETIQIPVFFEYFGPAPDTIDGSNATAAAPAPIYTYGKTSVAPPPRAALKSTPGAGSAPTRAAGKLDDFLDCYKTFKYGTITFKAEGGISSVSGKHYDVGVNATIDVDELLALFCDGNCPPSVGNLGGGGLVGSVAQKACDKLLGKILEKVGEKTKVIDVICKASNIIKALACAAAQIPASGGGTQEIRTGVSIPTGGGGGGGQGFGGSWQVSGAGCIVAGTPVTLADGTVVPIEKVAQGTRLLASRSGASDTVAQLMYFRSSAVRELTYRDRATDGSPAKTMRLTRDHRVWVDGRGWLFAGDVQPGAWLHGVDGHMYVVLSNVPVAGTYNVYGLHMDKDNVIYAGGVLTEDQCFNNAPTFSVSPQTGGAR